jgi:single-stranded-DNA-specific exonuclease
VKWIINHKDKLKPELLQYGLILAKVLEDRGLKTIKEVDNYFNPMLENIPNSNLLPNIDIAVAKIIDAVRTNKNIFIYGDYDVDGICSSAILFDFLFRKLKANVKPYIPNRFDEGYGLNSSAIDAIIEQGANLIITVDCGIRDSKLVNEYVKKGLDFVITDHHELPEGEFKFHKSVPVVHPGIKGSKYPNKDICATNVAWKVVNEIWKALENEQEFNGIKFDNFNYIDLVALATNCDVMPLIGENRIIMKYGIEQLKQTENKGLKAILEANKLDLGKLDAYHFGFVIGPRLNAAGRMESALTALRLLTSYDDVVVPVLVNKLEVLNRERQALSMKYMEEASIQADKQVLDGNRLLFIVGKEWSEGIIGLVSGKLSEKFHMPVLSVSINEGMVKGSARSIFGYNVTEAIGKSEALLEKFGGHNQAAGFTLKEANLEQFIEAMQNDAMKFINDEMLEKVLNITSELTDDNINADFVREIDKCKPFGYGNESPVFVIKTLKVLNISLVGKEAKHLKINLETELGTKVSAIGFNKGEFFDKIKYGSTIDLAFYLEINLWNGQEFMQLNIKDIKINEDKSKK